MFLIRLIPPTNEYNTTMEELSLFVGISVVDGENIWCIQVILRNGKHCALALTPPPPPLGKTKNCSDRAVFN